MLLGDVVVVPDVVGLTVRDAIEHATWAEVGIGRGPDGPPLESHYPGEEFVVTSQTPPLGTRLGRGQTLIVEMVSYRRGWDWGT